MMMIKSAFIGVLSLNGAHGMQWIKNMFNVGTTAENEVEVETPNGQVSPLLALDPLDEGPEYSQKQIWEDFVKRMEGKEDPVGRDKSVAPQQQSESHASAFADDQKTEVEPQGSVGPPPIEQHAEASDLSTRAEVQPADDEKIHYPDNGGGELERTPKEDGDKPRNVSSTGLERAIASNHGKRGSRLSQKAQEDMLRGKVQDPGQPIPDSVENKVPQEIKTAGEDLAQLGLEMCEWSEDDFTGPRYKRKLNTLKEYISGDHDKELCQIFLEARNLSAGSHKKRFLFPIMVLQQILKKQEKMNTEWVNMDPGASEQLAEDWAWFQHGSFPELNTGSELTLDDWHNINQICIFFSQERTRWEELAIEDNPYHFLEAAHLVWEVTLRRSPADQQRFLQKVRIVGKEQLYNKVREQIKKFVIDSAKDDKLKKKFLEKMLKEHFDPKTE